jgi:hypothetical protein
VTNLSYNEKKKEKYCVGKGRRYYNEIKKQIKKQNNYQKYIHDNASPYWVEVFTDSNGARQDGGNNLLGK